VSVLAGFEGGSKASGRDQDTPRGTRIGSNRLGPVMLLRDNAGGDPDTGTGHHASARETESWEGAMR
jgi:hypothetical protein